MKEYTGDVYIGVVGPETEYGLARDSIHNIRKQPGDSGPHYIRGTKGYETRQLHINKFIAGKHDFILLLDHDMIFAPDTLERLRSHKLPYVSGYYMRRRYNPIVPVWFDDNPAGEWPFKPFTDDPERGRLVRLGASGWGCVLVHREVILKVRELLKGEPEVIEDDMDVWPYDLQLMTRTIRHLSKLPTAYNLNERQLRRHVRKCAQILQREFRPLRGDKEPVGSDIRFPFFAKQAGYQLYGDPDVRPGHVLHYPLSPDDFSGVPQEARNGLHEQIERDTNEARRAWRNTMKELGV